jgi:hypothetical protein
MHVFSKQSIDEIVNAAPRILICVDTRAAKDWHDQSFGVAQIPQSNIFHRVKVNEDCFAPGDSCLWCESGRVAF